MFSHTCPLHTYQHIPSLTPFRFLDLPPEIRNHIASIVLTSDEPIHIRQPQYNRHPEPSPEPMFPSHPRLDCPLPRTPPPTPPGETRSRVQAYASSRSKDGHSRLAFLMACRRFYADHWATYYASNTFSFTPSTWSSFNAAIPERCRDQLRHVRVRMPYRSRHIQVWRALGELGRLETVDIILAPPGRATKLERVNCVQGVRFCDGLRRIRIEREGIGEGVGPLVDEVERKEVMEDKKVEKSINRDLLARWRRTCKQALASSGKEKVDASKAGNQAEAGVRAINASVAPDERAVDSHFSVVAHEANMEALEEL